MVDCTSPLQVGTMCWTLYCLITTPSTHVTSHTPSQNTHTLDVYSSPPSAGKPAHSTCHTSCHMTCVSTGTLSFTSVQAQDLLTTLQHTRRTLMESSSVSMSTLTSSIMAMCMVRWSLYNHCIAGKFRGSKYLLLSGYYFHGCCLHCR